MRDLDPQARDEADLAGAREGHLAELGRAAGLTRIEPASLTVTVPFTTFADWWEPFTLGVGPAGAYVTQAGSGAARSPAEPVRTAPAAGPVPDRGFSVVRAGSPLTQARRCEARAARPDGQRYHGISVEVRMTDMLIRDVPDDVIAGLDAQAGRLGLSRSEYVRRRLAQDAAAPGSAVSVQDLARFADVFSDLADPEVMSRAWQ